MSAGARIASAFHPTNLMAKGAKEGAGNQNVVYDVMREHDVVAGRPNQISKHKIVGVVVGCGDNNNEYIQGITISSERVRKCETQTREHNDKNNTGRHLNRHAQSFK